MTNGERIKQARLQRGMTQKELAEKLGVSESYVSQYERSVRNPKRDTLQKIAEALETTADALRGINWEVADPVDEEELAEHRRQIRQYIDLKDVVIEILRIIYGSAEKKEVGYKGVYQGYYLVGEIPHQHVIIDRDIDELVKSLPAFVERALDPRPINDVRNEMLKELKETSKEIDRILGKE